jgi:hypothetical protein
MFKVTDKCWRQFHSPGNCLCSHTRALTVKAHLCRNRLLVRLNARSAASFAIHEGIVP